VTALVEARKAKLVIIAHDVDPIELVVWLPALCRRFDVPYCIVKGKARLGQLIHMKTATCLAVTDVRKEHQAKLQQIIDVVRPLYNEAAADRKKWGGGTLGPKAQAVIRLREKAQVKEAARLAKA
jgi:large subunit ribosomal protein L7Ae